MPGYFAGYYWGAGSSGASGTATTIREAVVAALKADAAVTAAVGTRIRPLAQALAKGRPALAYQLVSDVPDRDLDGAVGTSVARVRIGVVGGPEELIDQVAAVEAVRALFDNFSGSLYGITVDEAVALDEQDTADLDPAVGDRVFAQTAVDYLFYYRRP